MRRREFVSLVGGATAWPPAASAQQPSVPVVGVLYGGSELNPESMAGLRKGLSEMGFVEGRNVTIEFRFANNQFNRLPELAAGLVRRRVAVIVVPNSTPAAIAAKAATTSIPIVFSGGTDPVRIGLVASLNRPGGNVTGMTSQNTELTAKRLGVLVELVPTAARIAILINPTGPDAEALAREAQAAISTVGRHSEILAASTNQDIDTAFANLVQRRAEALLVTNSNLFAGRAVQLATLATHHKVPAIYYTRGFAQVGGLMSYGPTAMGATRQVGIYTGRILKGEKPADLPVVQPTKFEFVINLQTARTLGIEIPPTLLALADEVIE